MGRPSITCCPELYAQILDVLGNLHYTDTGGSSEDMAFFQDDYWLCETAVIDRVVPRNGAWEVQLLFAHAQMPLKFLTRRITAHACPKKAEQMGFYMRKLAAKDQRGTLYVSLGSLAIALN